MSLLDRTPVEPSDAELIARVRGGDAGAYGDLFERHRDAALRLARSLVRGPDADDLVSEAFAKVFKVLQGGRGPDLAFRAYLLTAVRRLNVDRARAMQRATPTDDLEALDSGVPFIDPAVAGFEAGAAAKAFQSLPERWQLVLWHLEVEGQKPGDIAPLLGMSANSVSVLAYRAREGLRQAFLQMHSAAVVDDDCEWTRGKLGAYVRGASSRRDAEKVQQHLERCRRCTAVYLELTEVNSSLAAVLGPLVLGGAAAAYLGGTAAGAGGLGVVGAFFGRVVDLVTANTQAAVVAGAAATVAVAGTVTLAVTRDDPAITSARPAAPAVTSPTPSPPSPKPRPAAPRSTPAPAPAPAPEPEPPLAAAAVPTPSSAPAPEPEPQPEPAPDPSPSPSSEPDPEPTPEPEPAPAPTASMSVVRTWRHLLVEVGGPHRHTVLRITTAGIPTGSTATLELTTSRPLMPLGQVMPRGCTRSNAQHITCTGVTDGTRTLRLRTRTTDRVTVSARVTVDEG